jgi:hypothetical protein
LKIGDFWNMIFRTLLNIVGSAPPLLISHTKLSFLLQTSENGEGKKPKNSDLLALKPKFSNNNASTHPFKTTTCGNSFINNTKTSLLKRKYIISNVSIRNGLSEGTETLIYFTILSSKGIGKIKSPIFSTLMALIPPPLNN